MRQVVSGWSVLAACLQYKICITHYRVILKISNLITKNCNRNDKEQNVKSIKFEVS